MIIKFIVPKDHDHHQPLNPLSGSRVFPPVGLARMAGQAGALAHVSLLDERIDPACHELPVDVVVIFVNSYNCTRAYELAKHYKQNGSYVVLTGPLLNHEPEHACQYADCLFIGAGDELMPVFLEEYVAGRKRRLYRARLDSNAYPTAQWIVQGDHRSGVLSLAS